MAIKESAIREEIVFVPGRSLSDAVEQLERGNSYDDPQEAYNSVGYFDQREYDYEVFEFETVTRIKKVEPPYTPR